MKIYRGLEKVDRHSENIITVGTFDGVNLGHRYILSELKKIAVSMNGSPTLVTFDPHPKQVVPSKDRHAIALLTDIDEKIDHIQQLGVEKLIIIPFTAAFSQLSAQDYVRMVLYEKIGLKGMVVGYDHAFGRNREGGMQTLLQLASDLNFEVIRLEEYKPHDTHVSSSAIRNFLLSGDISSANQLLGYAYTVTGTVVHGDGRGKSLGFPTANIYIRHSAKLLPANGVYAISATIDEQSYFGMSNIGTRPTFDGQQTVLEAHLFDLDADVYDRQIQLRFFHKTRDEKKFSSVADLVRQLARDKQTIQQFFQNNQHAISGSQ